MHFANKTLLMLLTTFTLFTGCQSDKSNNDVGIDLANYTLSALSDEQKYSLAHMWFEEKLAYDLYLELYAVTSVQQLTNIASKSEINHISMVEDLVVAYDLNVSNYLNDYIIHYSKEELDALPRGKFAIPDIQTLYDGLFAKGKVSQRASLEAGCMVEVVDVDDLDHYIEAAEDNAALVDTFVILREGSYAHFWSFDSGLKNIGITDGCCSLGVEYCKPEYPKK